MRTHPDIASLVITDLLQIARFWLCIPRKDQMHFQNLAPNQCHGSTYQPRQTKNCEKIRGVT